MPKPKKQFTDEEIDEALAEAMVGDFPTADLFFVVNGKITPAPPDWGGDFIPPADDAPPKKGKKVMDTALARRLNRLEKVEHEPAVSEAEIANLAAGQPSPAHDDDDHAAHLRHHLNEKRVMMGKVMRGMMDKEKLDNLEAHVAEHRKMLEAEKSLPGHIGAAR